MTGAAGGRQPYWHIFLHTIWCIVSVGSRRQADFHLHRDGRRQATGDWRLGGSRRTRRGNALT